jgi:SPP1 family predicted phage head-tail adaptor
MQAGRMRERVAIQTNTPSQDAYGQPVESWATSATVWAEIVATANGTERAEAGGQQVIAESLYRITIRWRDDVSVKQRVVWTVRSRTFEIENIQDGSGRETIVLLCREVQA